ncbi:hypothetical protein STXM2123_2028 [Streptomyces sp. F-3]|nr:hypothetical protein STXM2123_2028 [Streptomyces sp. F-3]
MGGLHCTIPSSRMTAHGMGATLAHVAHDEQAAPKAAVSKSEKCKEVTGGTHTRIQEMTVSGTPASLHLPRT